MISYYGQDEFFPGMEYWFNIKNKKKIKNNEIAHIITM